LKKYYLVYKITNIIDGRIYIGVHQTQDLDDGYMGSGKMIQQAQKKHGIKNFKKEILFNFNSKEEMYNTEAKIVNEGFVSRRDTYNLTIGGNGGFDHIDNKGLFFAKDSEGNILQISINDPRYLNGELCGCTKDLIPVKDIDNNYFAVNRNDPRYLNGELVPIRFGSVLSDETKKKISESQKKRLKNVKIVRSKEFKENISNKAKERYKDPSKNPSYGTCWINKNKENKKIKKEELTKWLDKGWVKGRKMKWKPNLKQN